MSKRKVAIIKVDGKKDQVEIKRPSFFSRCFSKLFPPDLKPASLSGSGKKKKDTEMTPTRKINEAKIQKKEWTRATAATRWKCTRCAWCCRQNWRVNVTWVEYDRLKNDLNIEQVVQDPKTGMSHPLFEIKDACVCLNTKKNKCRIHSKCPYSCATFPFGIDPKGHLIYHRSCSGIGKGPLVDEEKMKKKIISERKKAGMLV